MPNNNIHCKIQHRFALSIYKHFPEGADRGRLPTEPRDFDMNLCT